jgi:cytoskeletal protein CcmA (bactofilin family)
MFGKNQAAPKTGTIDSLIGAGTVIEGNLKFRGGLRIDGHVRGDLMPAEEGQACTVIVSEHGRIDGSLRAAHIVIDGTVNGPVEATQHLDLQPKARVTGDIRYSVLEMHHGAVVQGALAHVDSKPTLKLATSNAN